MRIADIDLRHLGTAMAPGIPDGEGNGDLVGRPGNRELAVLECRVRQTKAEREHRLDAGPVEMTIAEEDALRVRDAMRARLELITIEGRAVFEAAFERHR